ncbi:MAG: hypothetical protein ACI9KE_005792 [Polyangiales bacterium]|jgi:hypothetical protein
MRLAPWTLALLLMSCASEPPQGCVVNRDCSEGQACVNGFCEPDVDGGALNEDGGVDAPALDSGLCGQPCDTGLLCEVGAYDCSSGTPVCSSASLSPADVVCRDSLGDCDSEEVCDGVSPTCPSDVMLAGTDICREASSECDVAEACTGSSAVCPLDQPQPAGTGCSDGFCDGAGMCVDTCTPGGTCSTGNPCESGVIRCETGEPVCEVVSVLADGESCGRSSLGPWSRCSGFEDPCDDTGFQSQSTITPLCRRGACVDEGRSVQRACGRETAGLACDGGNNSQCHVCSGGSCTAWISCARLTVCCEATNMCGCRDR